MKILVVNTDPDFGDMLKAGLKAMGHSVEIALTARHGLERLSEGDFALALVEYAGGGREFLFGYRDIDPLLAVVVLTSLPSQETAVEFLRGGSEAAAIDYVTKPDPSLIRRLSDLIDDRFSRIVHGDWVYDRARRRAFYRDEEIDLTPTELSIFEYFMIHPFSDVWHVDVWQAARGERIDREEAVALARPHLSRLAAKLNALSGREVLQHQHKGPHRFLPLTRRVLAANSSG